MFPERSGGKKSCKKFYYFFLYFFLMRKESFFFPCKVVSKKVFLERESNVNKASNLKRCW